MKTHPLVLILVLLGGLAAASRVVAAPGDLVPTYGDGGIAYTNTGFSFNAPGVYAGERGVKTQVLPDRSVLVAGDHLVWKLTPAGVRDLSFGKDGVVRPLELQQIGGLAVDGQGNIFVSGLDAKQATYAWTVIKLKASGARDQTFLASPPTGVGFYSNYVPPALIIQADGKIVAAGVGYELGAYGSFRVVVTRWLLNGQLDTTFGQGQGSLVAAFPAVGEANPGAKDIVQQADGKLLIAGYVDPDSCGSYDPCTLNFMALRLTPNGQLDTGFGESGWVEIATSPAQYDEGGTSVALQADGKILMTGSGEGTIKVARLTASGQLDATFASGGVAKLGLPAPGSYGRAIAVQSDGRIVVGGTRAAGGGLTKRNFVTARLMPNGSPDTSYGTGSIAFADFGLGDDEGYDMALDAAGAIVIAGTVNNLVRNVQDAGVLRFTPAGQRDTTFGVNGVYEETITEKSEELFGGSDLVEGEAVLVGSQKFDPFGNNAEHRPIEKLMAVRIDRNGALVSSFGDGGVWTASLDDDSRVQRLTAATIDPVTGKVYLAGYFMTRDSASKGVLIRLLPNGQLDTSFANNGKLILGEDLSNSMQFLDLHLNGDGSVVVLSMQGFQTGSAALLRVTPSGSIDTTFGDQGMALSDKVTCLVNVRADPVTPIHFVETPGWCRLTGQGDGKLLVTGSTISLSALVTQRFTANGALDPTFGSQGTSQIAFPTLSGSEYDVLPSALRLQADGKILASANVYGQFGAGWDVAFVRLLPNGAADPGFADGGKGVFNFDSTEHQVVHDFSIQKDGGIVFTGAAMALAASRPQGYKPMVGRLTGAGLLDPTFQGGMRRYDIGLPDDQGGFAWSSITPDGTLLTAGARWTSSTSSNTALDIISAEIALAPEAVLPDVTLTVTKAGTGSGTVTSSPAGIHCGSVCSADFRSGQVVTLTASPAAGSVFSHWSGACSGMTATCPVAMTADQGVTAHFAPTGSLTGLLAAVLPYARSVQVGQAATAFGTIINATGVDVTNCYAALPGSPAIAATFNYQTTNASNQLVGTPNTPVNIPAGGSQSFVFGITPTASFGATAIPLVFDCANTQPAPSQTGLNTFLLSASSTPVPDMIAIGATPSSDGVLRIPGSNGVHAFGTAAVNIGGAGEITATLDTGGVTLPLTLTLCQTNPGTGACLAIPASSTTRTLNTNASATYAVFAQASGAIPFDPAGKRIFLRLSSGGVVRGATSVAVTTQ